MTALDIFEPTVPLVSSSRCCQVSSLQVCDVTLLIRCPGLVACSTARTTASLGHWFHYIPVPAR
uniref:Uncharacterized protein n=1 Tax=Timema douglasi TaxID=61478 RepID=A0A7R8VK96_TIMDO|nr:unnamed protein product [Timema douglasi]